MAAPIRPALGQGWLQKYKRLNQMSQVILARKQSAWTKIFKRQKEEENQEKGAELEAPVRKLGKSDGPTTFSRLESLRKKTALITVRGYEPPPDVEQKVSSIAESILGGPVQPSTALRDRHQKFLVLTKLMEEFDHQIPNTELTSMNTLEDAINFFSIRVQDKSSYEDLAKLDLPPNLHIQMEPLRFNAETDTFFDGQTAFPGQPTVVTSLKYGRKFKGNQGESRNERSVTEFERNQANSS